MFDKFENFLIPMQCAQCFNKLQIYLAEPCKHYTNVLKFWIQHQSRFSILSQMAVNYLTIPYMFIFSGLLILC
jgi:hAT family protein